MASEPIDFTPTSLSHDGEEVIPIVAPTVAAFLGRTERGPLNEPVAIESFEEFRRAFGGHCGFSFVSHAVQHYFQHGGERAVVVRIANRALRATIEVPAGRERLRLQSRHPSSREYLRASIDYDRVERTADKFNLVVQRLSRPDSQLVEDQELFEGLSMDPTDERFVVDALHDSELVRLVGPLPSYRPEATCATYPGQAIPYLGTTSNGTDGEELTDYDIVGSNSEGTGLFALDRCENIDFICVPSPPGRDLGTTSFVAATRYCERRRALLIWDPPWSWSTADAAVLSLRGTGLVSQHAITYVPRVRPRGEFVRYPAGQPACGVVAGMLARCDRRGVWHRMPPMDTTLKGNLAPIFEVAGKQPATLQQLGVNTFIRLQPGVVALQGNATFAGVAAIDSLRQELGANRLIAFIVSSIERYTRWVFAARHSDQLAASLERQVWIFLSRLHRNGALASGNVEQSFFVRTAVPPQGRDVADDLDVAITLRVGFAPRAPNEFLVYDFRYHAMSLMTEIVAVLDAERRLG
jgi:Bacteriophage tail sheath protein